MIRLLPGDCLDVLRTLEPDSVHSCVTDPPYGLEFMGREWDKFAEIPRLVQGTGGSQAPFAHHAINPSGPRNGTYQAWCESWALEVFRVLKPGAYLLAFGGTRTYHRLACAIEDAGFEIRDQFGWLYGSGFPKSRDGERSVDMEVCQLPGRHFMNQLPPVEKRQPGDHVCPSSEDGDPWNGFGTAVKPAWEPLCLARKPMVGNLAQNLLKHGTGALNIDGCRVHGDDAPEGRLRHHGGQTYTPVPDSDPTCRTFGRLRPDVMPPAPAGRWPANVAHDGSDEVMAAFPDAPGQMADISTTAPSQKTSNVYGKMNREGEASADRRYTENGGTNSAALPGQRRNDTGSAARFFYTAKADKGDRADSKHPTIKPVDLLRHYVRLITPPGGTVLDCFAGSGTTGEAAMLEGFDCILIERDPTSVADIEHRIKRWSGLDTPLFAAD